VPTILVLEDDASTRDALARMLRDLFPRAHVIGAPVDAGAGVAARDAVTLVLTELAAVERVRRWLPAGALVIALTREMGPDTLLRAEALGVAASVRAPATTRRLDVVLEPMLGRDGASRARNPD
jgi:CheY-like chemotaxis protein